MKKFAVVFPGQGSQSIGMLNSIAEHKIVKLALEEASDSLNENIGELIKNGPKEKLDLTVNTQPIMLLVGVATWRFFQAESDLKPKILAGHSLGEYSALVASEVLSLTQALPLVRFRALFMQEAVPQGIGAMSAVLGLETEKVKNICQENSKNDFIVEAVNFNDPKQTVIAGHKEAVENIGIKLKEAGAKRVLNLPVSAPFHSSLMKPAAEKLKEKLKNLEFKNPRISVINNIDVLIENNPEKIKDSLYRQAFNPVRWVEIIKKMKNQGISHVVECGAGKVLTNLTTRIDSDLISLSLSDNESLAKIKEELK